MAPALAAPGDFDPTTPVRASAGYLNDYLRQNDAGMAAWDLGVATRVRYEVRDGFGIPGKGGAFNGGGPAIANGMVVATSGYAFAGGAGGNILLAFSVDGK